MGQIPQRHTSQNNPHITFRISRLINCVLLRSYEYVQDIAQVISYRFHTVADRVWSQITSRGVCGGKFGILVGFIQVLQSPMTILMLPSAPRSIMILSHLLYGLHNNPVLTDKDVKYGDWVTSEFPQILYNLTHLNPFAEGNVFILRQNLKCCIPKQMLAKSKCSVPACVFRFQLLNQVTRFQKSLRYKFEGWACVSVVG
jgi:hypothetical protein